MSYQALLFCADEKLARVVTQVFTELEFNVEPVNEPFSAVKKLMAQHYDAVVVDCENEQNASLLFKSARNSSTNQSSLALALVEGQVGVAKAYRIGANLVLTKPINIEQAKGTLRVARGLLRKNADAAQTAPPVAPAMPQASAPKPESATLKPAAAPARPEPPVSEFSSQIEEPAASEDFAPKTAAAPAFEMPNFEPALPAIAAAAKPAETMPSAVEAASEIPAPAQTSPQMGAIAPPAFKPAPTPLAQSKPSTGFATFRSAAAAPAPAKEVVAPAKEKAHESELFEASSTTAQPAEVVAAPTFSALDDQALESSGGGKKFVGIAAVILIVIGLGYFGWTKFGRSSTAAPSPSAIQKSQPAPAATTPAAPVTSNVMNETASAVPNASAAATATLKAGKPQAGLNSAPATKIAVGEEAAATPEVVTKKLGPAAIQVKNEPAPTKAQPQADEGTPVLPSPLAVGSGKDNSLASLVSGPAAMPVAPAGTLKISQGVSQGLLIKKVQPDYPQNARTMRIEGAVQMEALIDKEGKITNLKVVKGQPILAHAAMEAVRQWRYKPYYLDGQPVEIQTEITVMFKLPN